MILTRKLWTLDSLSPTYFAYYKDVGQDGHRLSNGNENTPLEYSAEKLFCDHNVKGVRSTECILERQGCQLGASLWHRSDENRPECDLRIRRMGLCHRGRCLRQAEMMSLPINVLYSKL